MTLIDAYSRLKAFKDNFPDKSGRGVSSDYVDEYHNIVQIIETETGLELEQYRISNEALKPSIISSDRNGNKRYTDTIFCKTEFFKMKVDGLFNRFEFMLNQPAVEEEKQTIGFKSE
jgi:hypothetical protein